MTLVAEEIFGILMSFCLSFESFFFIYRWVLRSNGVGPSVKSCLHMGNSSRGVRNVGRTRATRPKNKPEWHTYHLAALRS